MESVAANVELLVPLIGNGIHECLGRHGLVEGRVHDDCVRDIGHDLAGGFDSHDVGRHVKRSERDDGLELLDDLVGDKGALLEDLSPVQDPVAYGSDFGDVLDDAVSLVCDELYDELDCFFMGGTGELVGEFLLAGCLVLDGRILKSDSFDDAYCEDVLLIPVIYLILGGRASAVQCQNNHCVSSDIVVRQTPESCQPL